MSQDNLDLSRAEAWRGVWTALVTPLKSDGTLDEKSLETLIEAQIRDGVRGLIIAGSTGEGSLLSATEYERLLRHSRKVTERRIPIVAGLGIGGTESCLANLTIAKRTGTNGVLASPPAYVKAPQRGLVKHFLRLAAEDVPLCLYEVPSRAASSLAVETVVEIVQAKDPAAKNVVALKDATADLTKPRYLREKLGERLALLSGDDGTYCGFLESGGHGVISVVSHLTAPEMVQILKLQSAGQTAAAQKIQTDMNPLIDALFLESNPMPVKSWLARNGRIAHDIFKAPLEPMAAAPYEKLQAAWKTFEAAYRRKT